MLVLAVVGWLASVVMIGLGIAGASKIGKTTTTSHSHDSETDGPLRRSRAGGVAGPDGLGVRAEASTFEGKSKSVRTKGTFSPSDAADHPRVAVLLMGGFTLFIATFALFWFVVNDGSPGRWIAAPMWVVAAWLPVGYFRRVRSEMTD